MKGRLTLLPAAVWPAMVLLAVVWLAAVWLAVRPGAAAEKNYRIETHSPESWTRYYLRIGLGNVDPRPMSAEEKKGLVAHCKELDRLTDYVWHPLGYSMELGYKLCYRTGPFSPSDAEVLCQRLEMKVHKNEAKLILCGK